MNANETPKLVIEGMAVLAGPLRSGHNFVPELVAAVGLSACEISNPADV